MTKAAIVTRRRGRPRAEESAAMKMDKAMLDFKLELIEMMPAALQTLKGLLTSGTEKVKETTAKFIITEAKEAQQAYIIEENEDNAAGGTASASDPAHNKPMDMSRMPLTTQIREYKMAEGED